MVTVRGPRRASSRQRACARHHGVSAIFLHQISFHFDFFLYSLPLFLDLVYSYTWVLAEG